VDGRNEIMIQSGFLFYLLTAGNRKRIAHEPLELVEFVLVSLTFALSIFIIFSG
jgi:hypothetical protein